MTCERSIKHNLERVTRATVGTHLRHPNTNRHTYARARLVQTSTRADVRQQVSIRSLIGVWHRSLNVAITITYVADADLLLLFSVICRAVDDWCVLLD